MIEIDCEMFDKAVNHHRSADPGPARGDQLEVANIERLFQEPAAGDP